MTIKEFFNHLYQNKITESDITLLIENHSKHLKQFYNNTASFERTVIWADYIKGAKKESTHQYELYRFEHNYINWKKKNCPKWDTFKTKLSNIISINKEDFFPFSKISFVDTPKNLFQMAYLIDNLDMLKDYLLHVIKCNFANNYRNPKYFTKKSSDKFFSLVVSFGNEATTNINTNQTNFKPLQDAVIRLDSLISDCINLIQSNESSFYSMRIKFPVNEEEANLNWYESIFESLELAQNSNNHYKEYFNINTELLPFDITQQITYFEKDLQSIFNLLDVNKIIEGDSKDFIEMFTRNGTPTKPIKWIKKSDRKNKQGEIRGNQKMLYSFLKLMFNNKVTSENQIRASKLFIDHQGEFYNKYKGEVCFVGNKDIEKQLNEILKK